MLNCTQQKGCNAYRSFLRDKCCYRKFTFHKIACHRIARLDRERAGRRPSAASPVSALLSSRRLREHARPVLAALVGGGAYGCWAAFTHHRLGLGVAVRAGLTQLALSMIATLVAVLVLERLFCWPSNPLRGFWLAALGTSTLGTVWLAVGHALAGTPNIAVTIAPPVIVGTVSDFLYAGALPLLARRGADIAEVRVR
jgi:hypothetical protein